MRLLPVQGLLMSGSSGPEVTKFANASTQADNLIIFGLPEVESLPALKISIDKFFTLQASQFLFVICFAWAIIGKFLTQGLLVVLGLCY